MWLQDTVVLSHLELFTCMETEGKKRASFFKIEKRNRLFIDPRWYRFLASLALWNAVTSANYWDNSLFFHVHVYISLP